MEPASSKHEFSPIPPPTGRPPKKPSLPTRFLAWIDQLLQSMTNALLGGAKITPLKGRVSKNVSVLSDRLINALSGLMPKNPVNTFGYGIGNGGNSCYLNSIVQGLRALPSFREGTTYDTSLALPDHIRKLMTDNPGKDLRPYLTDPEIELFRHYIKQELIRVLDLLDWRTLSRHDSNHLRNLAIASGFPASRSDSQEDAQALLLHLLDRIGIEPPVMRREVLHEVGGARIASLESRSGQEMCLSLDVTSLPEHCTIQKLLTDRRVQESFEPHRAVAVTPGQEKVDIPNFGKLDLTPEVRAELARSRVEAPVPTLQTIQIEGTAPKMLLLSLKRYGYADGKAKKLSHAVAPSQEITLPLAKDPSQVVHYKLRAVTVHDDGGTQSINGGHYYTYALKQEGGKPVWYEYNDAVVRKHTDPNPVVENVARNGYVYFYEQVS